MSIKHFSAQYAFLPASPPLKVWAGRSYDKPFDNLRTRSPMNRDLRQDDRLGPGRSGGWVFGEDLAQVDDLIAEQGGLFELEVLGGGLHLGLEVLYEAEQVVFRYVA